MASRRDQHRSSRRGHNAGHSAGHSAYQECPVTYTQDPLYGSYGSGYSMAQQGLTVNPRDLTLHQVLPGDTQNYGSSGRAQSGYDTSGYPQSSGNDLDYLNTPHADLSGVDLGLSA